MSDAMKILIAQDLSAFIGALGAIIVLLVAANFVTRRLTRRDL